MKKIYVWNKEAEQVEEKQGGGSIIGDIEFKEHSYIPNLLIPDSIPDTPQVDLADKQDYSGVIAFRTEYMPSLTPHNESMLNIYRRSLMEGMAAINPHWAGTEQAEEHPPEKIAKAEQYLKECPQDFTPTMEKLRKIEEAGFYEIDEDKLATDIRELSDYPNYRFQLDCISYNTEREDFDTEIGKAPPKVRKQFKSAKELGIFEDFEIFKVKKVPDPILVGHFKGMQFEITRWT